MKAFWKGLVALTALSVVTPLAAEETIKVGLITALSGPFAANGRQMEDGARVYMQMHGDHVAGKKIELVVRDDTGVTDVTKRIAQELVTNDKVDFLAGFTLTPGALATAPLATQAKVPMIVMLGATSIIPDKSPFIVRSSLSSVQLGIPSGAWIGKQGKKTLMTLVADYAPGIDYENLVSRGFESTGGKVIGTLRAPLASPDFGPMVQKILDVKPDAVYVFIPPGGMGAALMKQLQEREVSKSGILIVAEGGLLDEEFVDKLGDQAIGYLTTETYSPAHDSDLNRKFVELFRKGSNRRPNLIAAYAYDGMHLIYEALRKTNGGTDGQANVAAMMNLAWESPRGPVHVDAATKDLIQNVYIRKAVKRADGLIWHEEIDTIPQVRDVTRPMEGK